MLRALDATHRQKFIHRDVKPDNIFINVPPNRKINQIQAEKAIYLKSQIEASYSRPEEGESTFSSANIRCEYGPLKLLQESIQNNDKARATEILSQATFKLGDYGFCRQNKMSNFRGFYGTPNYMSPQVLFDQQYSMKADIYSLGVLLYTLFYNRTPFRSGNIKSLAKDVEKGQIAIESALALSREGLQFIMLCMRGIEQERPSAKELLRHPWFTSKGRGLSLKEPLRLSIYKKMSSVQFKIHQQFWEYLEAQFRMNSAKVNYSPSRSQEWATLPLRKIMCWFRAQSLYSGKCIKKLVGQILEQIKFANCDLGLCYGAVHLDNIEVDVPQELFWCQREYFSSLAGKQKAKKSRKQITKIEREAYRHIKCARFRLLKPIFLQYKTYNQCFKSVNLNYNDFTFNQFFSYSRDIFCLGELIYELMRSDLEAEEFDDKLITSVYDQKKKHKMHTRTVSSSMIEESKTPEPIKWPVPQTRKNSYYLSLKQGYMLKYDELDFIARCLRAELKNGMVGKKMQEYEEDLSLHMFLGPEKEGQLVTGLDCDQVLEVGASDDEKEFADRLKKILQ